MNPTYTPTVARAYDDESNDYDILIETEVGGNEGEEVDMIIAPRTENSRVVTMTPEQAWNLARDLMRSATFAEHED